MIGVDSEKWIEWLLIMICTWKTVRQDCGNVSKWLRVSSLTSENFPPKICIPNNENIKMKRNKITSSEFIDEIEFTSDLTKLPNDDQYLKYTAFSAITQKNNLIIQIDWFCMHFPFVVISFLVLQCTSWYLMVLCGIMTTWHFLLAVGVVILWK